MTATPIPDVISERLRANLRAGGIPVSEADIQSIVEKGYLRMAVAFEALTARIPLDTLPDYFSQRAQPALASTVDHDIVGESLPPSAFNYPLPPEHPTGLPFGGGRNYDSLATVAWRIRERQVSSVELTEQSLAAIAMHDPLLNAFQVVLADRALAAARRADAELRDGNYRGSLHGVPIAMKDLFAMVGTAAAAGSTILAAKDSESDAAVVERLAAAGAVIVGKTRLPEFAFSPGSNNAHYGPTRNPWHLEHDTGGSSSGSGAALAAGMVYGALGSDTGGSIRIPGALCGIVGLKPTFGRVSLHGAVSLAWSLNHAGPMARTVEDVALLLDVLAGDDARDSRTLPVPVPYYARFVTPTVVAAGAQGLRIGVLRDDGSGQELGTPNAMRAWKAGLAALEGVGATLIEVDLPELNDLRTLNTVILVLEASAYHQDDLRDHLHQLSEFFSHRLLQSFAYGPAALVRAQQARAVLRRRCESIFEQVDLLSTPSMPFDAPLLGTPSAVTFTAPFNTLGWPAITVPVGLSDQGLPLGLQLAGKPWDEGTVLHAAAVLQAVGPWQS